MLSLPLPLNVFHLLLLQYSLQYAVASHFVHVQDFVSYDSIDAFLWQVIEHAPVGAFVLKVISQAFDWVF